MLLCLIVARGLLLTGSPAQARPEHLGESRTAPSPKLSPADWAVRMPSWQKAPDGIGEFLPLPQSYHSGVFTAQGQVCVVAPPGVVTPKKSGNWEIAGELYGHPVFPVGKRDGVLWATDWGGKLLALNPRNWSIEASIPTKAKVIAVDAEGFWCLEDYTTVSGRPGVSGHRAVAYYAMNGKEEFRFVTRPGRRPLDSQPEQPAPASGGTPDSPKVHQAPEGMICWASVDKKAVWLAVIDYQGIMPNDAPIYGSRKMVRVDSKSGVMQAVDANVWPSQAFVDLPEAILWLTPTGNRSSNVCLLEKSSLSLSMARTVDVPGRASILATDGVNLWAFSDKPYVFSLKDFRPVPLEEAGNPPPDLPPDFLYGQLPRLQLLDGDNQRVWLIAPPSLVIELRDNGAIHKWDVSRWFTSSEYAYQAVARSGCVYIYDGRGTLIRIASESENVVARQLEGATATYPPSFAVSDEVVWVMNYRGESVCNVSAFSPDLRKLTTVGLDRATFWDSPGGLALDRSLYVLSPTLKHLMRIDANTGKVTRVESWRKHVESWCPANRGRTPNEGDFRQFLNPVSVVCPGKAHVALFTYWITSATAPHESRLITWRYDPRADQWGVVGENQPMAASVRPLSPAHLCYDMDSGAFFTPEKGGWRRLGRLAPDFSYLRNLYVTCPTWATKKYFYARLPLGLFRVAWERI